VVMLSVYQEPTSCRELFNPHEICTLYARTCTIIMASGCSDPTRNPINVSSLSVAQSSLRQSVHSSSEVYVSLSSTVAVDQGSLVYISLYTHLSTQNFTHKVIRKIIFNDLLSEKMDMSQVATDK